MSFMNTLTSATPLNAFLNPFIHDTPIQYRFQDIVQTQWSPQSHQVIKFEHNFSFNMLTTNIIRRSNNLLQLPFLGKLTAELIKLLYYVLASLDNCLLRCQATICRYAKLEKWPQWVRSFVPGKQNMFRLQEALLQQICKRMIFLVKGKNCRIRYT
jgi:hypothetical protein